MSDDKATPPPWSVSDVQTVEGEYMVVGGAGHEFGMIASCPVKADAELIVRLHNECGVQSESDSGAPQPRGESTQTNATQPAGSPNLPAPNWERLAWDSIPSTHSRSGE